jgi:hypothetical protein
MHTIIKSLILGLALTLTGCSTVEKVQYAAWEKVGVHKRDILVDRIQDTAEAQEEAKQEFKSAYEELATLINVDDKGLDAKYKQVAAAYERSEDSSESLKDHIASVDSVANNLFAEWEQELTQYTSDNLRNNSAANLAKTKKRYATLYKAMQDSYSTIPPVLNVLRDNTLYLKHNLNANAISSMQGEVKSIRGKVDNLIKEMESSINESQQFIEQMKKS